MYRYIIIYYVTLIPFLNIQITVEELLRDPSINPPPVYSVCSSYVYCQGLLLDYVQFAKFYPTSKVFVDMKMNRNESEIMDDFDKLLKAHNQSIPKKVLKNFIEQNFQHDNGLEKWMPSDFKAYPPITGSVQDETYKEFLTEVNQIWKDLARKISKTVEKNNNQHSMIYVPNGFFVNMEYQEDFYYWDTYWIIRGALICGMEKTVKGILENLIHLIKNYGYILSGNRVYYEGRSQLPLLPQMMHSYYTFTKDESFILDNIEFLDAEMMFWLRSRSFQVKDIGNTSYSVVHYTCMSDTFNPRPEMYNIDVTIARKLKSLEDEDEFWCRTKATTESGWGFSSRHFHNRFEFDDSTDNLLKTNPLSFVYVELNSIMESNARILSKIYLLKNNKIKSDYYTKVARHIQVGINALLWNDNEQIWLDFDTSTADSRNYFYASNLAPLWTKSYDEKLSEFYGDAAVNYLIINGIITEDLIPRYFCIPTSLYNSELDWDYNNCWPQLQSMVIFGLHSTKSERAKRVAFNFASSWVHTNYVGYKRTKTLFEKYNSMKLGDDGTNQLSENAPKGFGVTMGLLFEIFLIWGDILRDIS